MERVEVYISEDKLQERIKKLGKEISDHYGEEEVYVLCILNGAFMFASDLVRHFTFDAVLKFVKASSYGHAKVSSGKVDLSLNGLEEELKGKNVLIVEDIVDTGHTYCKLIEDLTKCQVKDIKFSTLLFKKVRLEREVNLDYVGFEIEDKFVIGYGLDLEDRYRELPFVGIYN